MVSGSFLLKGRANPLGSVQQFLGGDMTIPSSRLFALGSGLLGATPTSEHPMDRHLGRQIAQHSGDHRRGPMAHPLPVLRRYGDHHPGIDLGGLVHQGEVRDLAGHLLTMSRPQVPLEHGQGISRDHRHAEGKQGGAGVAQAGHVAVQQVGQGLKVVLRLPTIMPPKRGAYIGPLWAATHHSQRAEDAQVSLVVAGFGLGQLREHLVILPDRRARS
jgi:hypothetical protein